MSGGFIFVTFVEHSLINNITINICQALIIKQNVMESWTWYDYVGGVHESKAMCVLYVNVYK